MKAYPNIIRIFIIFFAFFAFSILTGCASMMEYWPAEYNAGIPGTVQTTDQLIRTIELGNYDKARRLVEAGADLNSIRPMNKTPLSAASFAGNSEMVKLIIQKGADVKKTGAWALAWSVIHRHNDITDTLLKAGAEINDPTVLDLIPFFGWYVSEERQKIKTEYDYTPAPGDREFYKFILSHPPKERTRMWGYHMGRIYYILIESIKKNDLELIRVAMKHGESWRISPNYSWSGYIGTTNDGKWCPKDRYSLLEWAVLYENKDAVSLMLESGFDVNKKSEIDREYKSDRGYTPLILAAQRGNIKIADLLLSKGADINYLSTPYKVDWHIKTTPEKIIYTEDTTTYTQYSPLMIASASGKLNMVKFLLSRGADVNLKNESDQTALNFAYMYGNADVAKALIGSGAKDISEKDKKKYVVDRVRTLKEAVEDIEAGMSVSSTMKKDALKAAAESGECNMLTRLLKKVKYEKDDITYALLRVSGKGDVACMKVLLEAGGDASYRGYTTSVLSEGVKSRKPEAVKILLDHGAMKGANDADSSYRGYNSSIMHASGIGDLEIVKMLVEKGANVNNINIWTGDTPLLCAADKGKTPVAEYLISKGADVNKYKTYEWPSSSLVCPGITPLMMAAYNGNVKLVKALLKSGADIKLTDSWGEDALVKAKKMKHEDIVNILINAGAPR